MQRVNIIGAGKVGRTMMTLVAAAPELELGDVLGRKPLDGSNATAAVGAGRGVTGIGDLRPAELWVLSVPDDRIEPLAAELAERLDRRSTTQTASVIHCSGFLSSDVLTPLRALGWSVASCHPVLGFADPHLAAARFPGTLCAVEGDPAAARCAEGLVTALGGLPFAVDPERKALYHAAAVFSNNFATVLQALAQEAWAEAGVAPDIAARLGNSLLAGAAESVARLGPAAALTGPAARGDRNVLQRQRASVAEWRADAGPLYDTLSRMARQLKTDGVTGP
jgi:predicted short-subunit dehydrogenase-like oxidoreductase (DUF2520 family)